MRALVVSRSPLVPNPGLWHGFLPLTQDQFERQLETGFRADKLALNIKAFRLGLAVVRKPKKIL